MGLRVRKSFKIAPGIKLNVGKKGVGFSFGTKGFRYSIGTSGRRTTTIGIPGTGISYSSSKKSKSHSKYSSSKSKAAKLKKEREKAAKEKQKQLELEYAKAAVEEYNNLITALKTIHIAHQDNIDWKQLNSLTEPYPDPSVTPGPKEQESLKKKEEYKPGFLARHIKFIYNSKIQRLEKLIEESKVKDKELYENWVVINNLSTQILNGNTDAMLEVIENENIFDELIEFGSGFEIGFLSDKLAEVEFSIKADDVIPKESKTLTATGKLSTRKLSKSARLDIMQDYVCSCILRIAGDLFAYLPIDGIYITAMDSFIDSTVGSSEDKDIVSVHIDRVTYNKLNLELIDPSDSMDNFICNMKFLKTKGFKPIERVY